VLDSAGCGFAGIKWVKGNFRGVQEINEELPVSYFLNWLIMISFLKVICKIVKTVQRLG